MTNKYVILVRNPEGNWALGKYKLTWKANIKTDCKETVCEGVDWCKWIQQNPLLKEIATNGLPGS